MKVNIIDTSDFFQTIVKKMNALCIDEVKTGRGVTCAISGSPLPPFNHHNDNHYCIRMIHSTLHVEVEMKVNII